MSLAQAGRDRRSALGRHRRACSAAGTEEIASNVKYLVQLISPGVARASSHAAAAISDQQASLICLPQVFPRLSVAC
eukprot:COSAG02_NODE_63009_length_264_cov_0.757576_1_plen_76_part_01